MNLIADENLDAAVVAFLRNEGHDVLWMVELAPGTSDMDILKIARQDQRVILTFDRDFGELVFHRGESAVGIIFLRLLPPSPAGLLDEFRKLWPQVASKAVGNFIVVAKDKVRIRPIKSPN